MSVGAILAVLTALFKAVSAALGLREKLAAENQVQREREAHTRHDDNARKIAEAMKGKS